MLKQGQVIILYIIILILKKMKLQYCKDNFVFKEYVIKIKFNL